MNLDKKSVGEVGPLLGLLFEGDEVLDSKWLTQCHITVSWCGYVAISRGPAYSCMRLQQCDGLVKTINNSDSVFVENACELDDDTISAIQWLDCEFSESRPEDGYIVV
jgi:hypothetical protein